MARRMAFVLVAVFIFFAFSLIRIGIRLTRVEPKNAASFAVHQHAMEVQRINSLIKERFEQNDIPQEPLLRARQYISVPRRSFCDGRDFLVVVHTRMHDLRTRNIWRRTYGSFQAMYRFALMFVVGKASTLFYKELLENEVNNYGDILVADFEDTYKNLTLKNLAGLRYVLVACPEVPAVLKMDDDVAWNMEKAAMLANFTAVTNKIHCALYSNIPASRDTKRKWYVSYEEWSEEVFPPFCFGLAYTLPREAIVKLLQALQTHHQKFLWLDDIFVTGVLARLTTVSRININTQYNYKPTKETLPKLKDFEFLLCLVNYFTLIVL